jgi:antitoxin component YwqK of YwqJK toxin-antitoxin module
MQVRKMVILSAVIFFGCRQTTTVIQYSKEGKKVSEVEYRNSLKDGQAIIYYENGRIKEKGIWQRGKQAGLWRFWYESGTLFAEIPFINDLQDGLCTFYYPNGKIQSESNFKQGRANGISKLYFDNGVVSEISNWQDNVLQDAKLIFDSTGKQVRYLVYKSGKIIKDSTLIPEQH